MSKKKAKINIYQHSINLSKLRIKNQPSEKFRQALEKIKYRGYEVENISDGRKIVITKPGGKFSFGTIKRDDFMVWVYNEKEKTLWLISHRNIFDDLEEKAKYNSKETLRIIEALTRVYNGEEPDKILEEMDLMNPYGEQPEVLLKAYKWIWGQEDCNYPPPKYKGRQMSMEEINKLKERLLSEK
ncbi:MAG: hypothetical protein N2Z79_00330 [Candidatus Omnitrophica bacterium]|nr:hypothetical protein [Candidatus Omnitrophota bacterium]